MRGLALYPRSRSVPAALAVIMGSAVAPRLLAETTDDRDIHGVLTVLAVLAGTAAITPASPAPTSISTTPRRSPGHRAVPRTF